MSIVDTAKAAVGKVKYIFAASAITNSNGTLSGNGDCSSFTQQVFKANGIDIGRSTQEQWTGSGVKVKKADLQEGDLVFFKNTYNSGNTDGVSHVGVYIGDGKFIHNSSGAGQVVTSNLNDTYYQNHYLGAKRINATTLTQTGNRITDGYTYDKDDKKSSGDTDLKFWGDLIVLILTCLCVLAGGLFFIKAFQKFANNEVVRESKKIIKKTKNVANKTIVKKGVKRDAE